MNIELKLDNFDYAVNEVKYGSCPFALPHSSSRHPPQQNEFIMETCKSVQSFRYISTLAKRNGKKEKSMTKINCFPGAVVDFFFIVRVIT